MQKIYAPANLRAPAIALDVGCETTDHQQMPGAGSCMNPGHDGKPNLRHTVQDKFKRYQREREPVVPRT